MGETFIYWSQSPWYIQETHKVLENVIPRKTAPAWTEMNNNNKKDKESFLICKTLQGGNRLILLLSSIHMISFYKKKKEKKNNSGGRTARQEGGTSNSDCRAGRWTHCFQNLKPDSVCLAGFWNYLGSVTQFLFSSLPFWDEVSITTIDSPTTVFWEQIIF